MPLEPAAISGAASLPVLVRVATASPVASFGLAALLFFLRSPGRRWLLSYSALAIGISAYLLLPLAPQERGSVAPRLALALSFALPALGYFLLASFSELRFSAGRVVLLSLPVMGFLLSLSPAGASQPHLGTASGIILLALALEFLSGLWRQGRRRRPEAPLLFVGTGALVLAVLAEAGINSGVLLVPRLEIPLVGPAFLFFTLFLLVAVADEGERTLTRATTDLLTGLPNRTAFLERARREMERASRAGSSLAVAILDIDRFKSINDRFGHPEGDRVLVAVAKAMQTTVRGIDLVARWGGEEFVLLFVDVDQKGAIPAIERVRAAIAAIEPPRVPERITVSAGITLHFGQFESSTVEELIQRADVALYESKRKGRDRTTLAEIGPEIPESAADVRYR